MFLEVIFGLGIVVMLEGMLDLFIFLRDLLFIEGKIGMFINCLVGVTG